MEGTQTSIQEYSSDEEEVQDVPLDIGEILECEGIPRHLWSTKIVILHNETGLPVAEGICHSVNSNLVLGVDGPLGDSFVAIQILKSLHVAEVPNNWRYSLRAWPIDRVYLNGASLKDHEDRDEFNCKQASFLRSLFVGTKPYESVVRGLHVETIAKAIELLTQESINSVSSKVCCAKNCLQPFSREKIRAFRERMYQNSTFKFHYHMKLDVHRQVHQNTEGKKVVTMEGIEVYMAAWRHISGVSESTFHRFQGFASRGEEAQSHGNLGTVKIQKHTLQATATLKCMLEKTKDHMPHKSHTLPSGDKVVSMVMPATFKWKDTIPQVNTTNVVFGLKKVLVSNISKIRKKKFPQYNAKKPEDNFARCAKCDRFKTLRKTAILPMKRKWHRLLNKHLERAWAHRDHYYVNHLRSSAYPHECLTIIHDKMDHAKTASPVFSHKSKQLDGLMKLTVSMTGMIAHEHRDVKYAHYGLDIFSHDSNYTMGSFAKLLQDVELLPTYSSRELFTGSGSAPLFQAVLEGFDICKSSLRLAPMVVIPATLLPSILNVQMDNATGDNKNRFVFAFWSFLVAKKVFCEVYVSFMLVGHTHDDTNALFGRWSMQLKKDNFPTIPSLMKSFMDVDYVPTILHLIEEVPDFKAFIEGSLLDEDESLTSHTKAQQFKFYLNSTSVPIMKYKNYITDSDWFPKEGEGIKLWQEDLEGESLWPCGEPMSVVHVPMRSVDDIYKGLSGFIKYWDTLCDEDGSGEYRRRFEHLVFY